MGRTQGIKRWLMCSDFSEGTVHCTAMYTVDLIPCVKSSVVGISNLHLGNAHSSGGVV